MSKNYYYNFFLQAVKTVIVIFFTALFSVTSFAQNYTPNTFTDPVITTLNNATGQINGGATISLRSALMAADNLGGTHTVFLSTGTYNLSQPIPNRQITIGNTAQNITITGNGPANTIINMVNDADKDRILFINPVGTTNNVVTTVQNLKIQNGYLSSDPYGGAGICAGGGTGNALIVTNCIFDNNILPANAFGGAAVCMQVSGDLTIDNCTFTNNVSNDADGGAVLFIIFNNPGYDGDLLVTNSTFTGNSVIFPGAGTSNGGALAFTGQGGIVGTFNVTINNNTFTNNSADGLGGAIAANNSPNLSVSQIHYNRIVNNTSTASASSSGLHFAESSGSVNAENNWWGCNTNPVNLASTAPCNQAGGDVAGGGSLDANPWLQLRTTASPNPICNTPAGLGNTTTVTTSFLNNSDGTAIPVANLSRLIGLPVTWGPTTLGTLSAQQASIQASGTATATFTSNGTGGTATVNTQVDNVPAGEVSPSRASITVNTLPTVTNPVNFTSCVGGTVTFTSTITGSPAPTITWRIGTTALVNGLQGSGSTVSGQGTNTLTITNVQPGDAATNYNVQAINVCGTATSADVTLFVNSVTGGTVGSDQTICSGGDPASFTESLASTGSGALTYQWQSSTTSCVAGFSNIVGATATTYDPPAGLAVTTYYRRVTTSTLNTVPCTAISNCITVTVNNVTGGTVAADQTICSGGNPAAFTQTVASTGSGALTYQWQSSTTSCAAGFSDIGGATATTYDPPAGLLVTTYYRRVVTSTLNAVICTANSNCVTVFVNGVTGGTVGSDQTICYSGDPAAFTQTAASTGSGTLTYQWQSSTTSCIAGFSDIGGATGTTYNAPSGLTVVTYYRRVTTSTLNAVPCTANSNCITVTVNPAIVVTNPVVTTGTNGVAFSETFTQTGAIGGATFTTASSLPNGLTLSTAGVLSGTPSAPAGTYPITVVVTDGNSCTGTGAVYNLVISCQAMSVTNPVVTTGQIGVAFSQTFTQTGGIGATTFSTASSLPAGLTLSTAGVLSGTPTATGTFPIVVRATDANGCFADGATYTLVISACPVITVTNPAVTTGTAGVPFSQTFTASGGIAPYTFTTASTLPVGLTLSAAGVLSGTPTQSGTFPIVVTATDNNACTGNGPTYNLVIGCNPVTVNITGGGTFCGGTTVTLTATAGFTSYAWARFTSAGYTTLGITTPTLVVTQSGNYRVTVTDAYGCTGQAFASVEIGDYLFTGGLSAGDASQANRILVNGTTSTCAAPKACPGNSGAAGPFVYDLYNVTNNNAGAVCAVIALTANCGEFTTASAYLGSFNPANNCTNYLGDLGSAITGGPMAFEVTIPAGATVVIKVNNFNSGLYCNNYRVVVDIPRTAPAIITSPATTVCAGTPVTLTASVANSYLWSPGGATTQSINVSPSNTTTYTVTLGYGNNGCTATASQTITVNPNPVVSIIPAGPVTICPGGSVTLTASATCNNYAFSGLVTGSQEVPANASTARGLVNGTFNATTNQLTLNIVFNGLTGGAATAAHLHNAAPGVSGPVIIPFAGFPAATSGSYSNTYTLTPAQVSLLLAGNTYVNIHNATFPGGEIRGQISNLVTNGYAISGPMNGGMEVPPNASTSTGNFAGTYNDATGMLKLDVIFNNLIGGNATAAHVHNAAPGVNGPVIIPLTGFPAATSGNYSNIFAMPPAQVTNFLAGNTYINIHNAVFPGGEIRGQIAPPAAICTSNTYLWSPGGATTQSITVSAANTYTVTVTDGNSCSGSASVVVNVNPTPTVDPVPNQTVCNGSATAAVNFTGSVAGTVYNWTNNNASIGLAGSGTGNIASFTAINTGSAPVVATITVTPSYTNGGTTCTGTPITFTITVNPTPDVAQPANQVVCNGAPTAPINFTGSVAGTIYNWTNNTTSIGLAASGTGNIASFTATNVTNAPVVATVTVTPSTNSGGAPFNFTNCGASGITGPSQAQATAAYVGTPLAGQVTIIGSGIQQWTVPTTGLYTLSAAGASGGYTPLAIGGRGRIITTDVNLVAGQVLNILVGQEGGRAAFSSPGYSGGGGGGTFIINQTTSTPILISGGGGGAGQGNASYGTPVINGVDASAYNVTNGGNGTGFAGSWSVPGIGGSGGAGGTAPGNGGAGGGGYSGNGQTPGGGSGLYGGNPGISYLSGGSGGINRNWFGGTTSDIPGGFGGGAGAGTHTNYEANGGGAGGYSGGGGSNSRVGAGGGGGNLYTGTYISSGLNTGMGYVTISSLGGITCTGSSKTFTITVNPTATVNAVASQVVCNGALTTAVNFTSPTTGGTIVYNWTNNTPSIGLAASGTGNIASFTSTNSGTAPVVATVTVTPTYTNGGVSCIGTPITFTYTVNPTATVDPVANQVLCNGANSTAVNFTSPTTGGTIVYNWTNNTPSIGLAASGTGNIPSFVAVNLTNAPVVATVTVTPTYTNGGVSCVGTATSFTITVNPPPIIDPVANQVVCNNSATANINFTTPTTGGTAVFNWTNNNTSIGLAASGTGDILSFNATNATNAPVVATITVTMTYTSGGISCVSLPLSFTITVNPTPVVNQPANQVVCSNTATAAVNFTSPTTGGTMVYNWTNNTPSIGLAASGTGNIPSFTAINNSGTAVTATIVVTPTFTNGGVSCTGSFKTFTITVNPTPVINPVTSQVVCNGSLTAAVNFTGTVSPSPELVYNWTNNTTSIGLAASGTGNIAAFTATNTTNAPVVATITVIAIYTNGSVSCTSQPVTFTITVNPTAIVNPVANQVVCNGSPTTAVNFSSPTTGGTIIYNWNNNNPSVGLAANGSGNIASFTATNITNAPVTATITVTPVYTSGGISCSGTPRTFTITVNPTPTINQPANQVLCHGSPTAPVIFTGSVPGTVYSWVNNNTSIGLGGGADGDIPSFIATNVTNVPQVATITVTPTYTNGGVSCTGTSRTFTITVNPIPSVSQPANQTVCAGATVTTVFSGPVAGTVYAWTNTNTAIGLVASGTGNLNFISTNTSGAPITGTITVTPRYTNGGVTCTGNSVSFTITVNPVPTVNPVANQVVCTGSATTAITLTGPVSGTVYTWTNNQPSIGLAAAGTGNIPSFIATNITNAPVVATVIVTPTYTNGGVTCTGPTISFTITVNPTPSVNAIANQTVCNGVTINSIVITGPVAGTVFTWTNNNTAIGLAGAGTGNIPAFMAINTTNVPITATITVTPTYTNGGVSCSGTPISFTITVNPTPTVNAVPNQSLCNGSITAPINFTGAVAGTVYSWTNNNTAIGLAASGTGNIAAFTAINTTNTPITATITVTPSAAGCTGSSTSFTITVNPTPTVNQPANQTVCDGSSTLPVVFTGAVAGTLYSWTNNSPQIGLGVSGTGNIPAFIAKNATPFPVVATITVTPSFNNGGVICTGASVSFTITVNPQPNIVFNMPPRACLTDTLITLKAFPVGGTWTGPGVSGNTFSAAAAGLGVHLLTYTFTNSFGCTAISYFNITVNDCKERHNVFATAIRIYPNPSSGRFNISFLSDLYKEFNVRVVTSSGQELKVYHFDNLRYGSVIPMDMGSLPQGTYWLQIYNASERAHFPFVIVR